MPKTALDLFATKAKLAGAVVLGGLVATAGIGGGALSLVADSSEQTPQVVVTASTPSEDAQTPEYEAPEAPEATEAPEASEAPEATETPEAPAASDPAEAESDKVVLNHATVVSISATSLVVTAQGATTTWTLSAATRYTGAIKDPAAITPGMVIQLRGTKAGAATHVITPGNNKPKQEKKASAAKGQGKKQGKSQAKKARAQRQR